MNFLGSVVWCAALFFAASADEDSSTCEQDTEGKPLPASAMLQKAATGVASLSIVQEEQMTQQVSFAESRANALSRVKLLVESDLDKLDASHFRAYRKEESCQDNANNAFDHFVGSTGFAEELTPDELDAFRKRFVDELDYDCKHDPEVIAHWIEDIQTAVRNERPVMTEALAASINNAHLSYQVAMQEWMVHESALSYQQRMGKVIKPEDNVTMAQATESHYRAKASGWQTTPDPPPDSFESSAKWPMCSEIFEKALNQGTCGSCWAFGALLAADSRLCVATNGLFSGPRAQLSRGFVTSCANDGRDGCNGDLAKSAFRLLSSSGVPTGGSNGCKPYWGVGEGTDHFQRGASAPPCPSQCEGTYDRSLSSDLFRVPGIGNFREIWPTNAQGDRDAKLSMMEHGPLSFGIYADSTFMGYSAGIHDERCGVNPNHEVVAIGWGPGFIQGMNSWGPNWGANGGFKVADCKVTDWTIPGAISREIASSLPSLGLTPTPSPVPSPSPPPTTPKPEPSPTPVTPAPTQPPAATPAPEAPFSVTGDCEIDKAGCVTSNNFPYPYGSHEHCTIGKEFGKIQVMQFSTELVLDRITVNNNWYYGKEGPHNVIPKTDIEWESDHSLEATGWRLCPEGKTPTPPPTPAPTPAPTPPPTPPTPAPTPRPTPRPTPAPKAPINFKVTGPCVVDADGCVTSPNWPKKYGANQRCTITKSFGKIKVVDFSTEWAADTLKVNGRPYSGTWGPENKVPTKDIVWKSDWSVEKRGFKICPADRVA